VVCKTNQKRTSHAELKVNGKQIELNNFVENFISQAVIGMVQSLRSVADAETISLKISKETK
jgi:hypothetical protein